MILILGGTTEGRIAAKVCEEAGKPFYYSTKTSQQDISCPHALHIYGGMDENEMEDFCKKNDIKLLIDAAHPFADNLHKNIAVVSEKLNIPTIRLERTYTEEDNGSVIWLNSYNEAVDYLTSHGVDKLLALTGVSTIFKLKPYWQNNDCWFRILDREESREFAVKEGFPLDKILYYNSDSNEYELYKEISPQAILTKESGETGGFNDKLEAAQKLNIPVLVIRRPTLSDKFITVYGQYGLRKQIEKILPDFFPLHIGFTTGTCATAAAKAALLCLITQKKMSEVYISLPDGEKLLVPIENTVIANNKVSCTVIKDAGDDPDITNGLEIISTVEFSDTVNGVVFLQGEGVGIVTLEGLGLEVGGPAINATPRKMIEHEVEEILAQYPDFASGVYVTISVPKGKEIAQRTFNPKLGVVDGISIIGTSGIVKPFSSEAFVNSIRKEMTLAKTLGCEHIVINSGAKSEGFVRKEFPCLLNQAFIHYGNFIGETIKIASELEIKEVSLGVMIGKAVKLAEGNLDTHSKNVIMNKPFLIDLAKQAGCSSDTIKAIEGITLARQLWDIIPENKVEFFSLIVKKCYDVCSTLLSNGKLTVMLISEKGMIYR